MCILPTLVEKNDKLYYEFFNTETKELDNTTMFVGSVLSQKYVREFGVKPSDLYLLLIEKESHYSLYFKIVNKEGRTTGIYCEVPLIKPTTVEDAFIEFNSYSL